jgi:hypothetical protein
MTTQVLPERTIAPADLARMNSGEYPRILGLDLSLTATGWCFGGAGEWGVDWGVHETKKLRGMERLAMLQTAIQEPARLADRSFSRVLHSERRARQSMKSRDSATSSGIGSGKTKSRSSSSRQPN